MGSHPHALRSVAYRYPVKDPAGRHRRRSAWSRRAGRHLQGFARYTVREIFSASVRELQDAGIRAQTRASPPNGIVLRSVLMGNVDLPPDYRAGMDKLLAVELETER